MANHKSALKRVKQSETKRLRNKAVMTRVRGMIKKVDAAVETNNGEQAGQALSAAAPLIAKAASKGVIHRRNAARKISRLAKKVHQLQAAKSA